MTNSNNCQVKTIKQEKKMGCDIHLHVEKKIGQEWVCIDTMSFSPWANKPYTERELSSVFDDRNYSLFRWLAQVRGTESAGFEAKGFPSNTSKEVSESFNKWSGDAHTPSYLTLEELNSKFKGKITISGMMKGSQLAKLENSLKDEQPNYDLIYPYCQLTTDKESIPFSVEVPMSWKFSRFYDNVIQFMERHSYGEGGKSSVRIVFWFDN